MSSCLQPSGKGPAFLDVAVCWLPFLTGLARSFDSLHNENPDFAFWQGKATEMFQFASDHLCQILHWFPWLSPCRFAFLNLAMLSDSTHDNQLDFASQQGKALEGYQTASGLLAKVQHHPQGLCAVPFLSWGLPDA